VVNKRMIGFRLRKLVDDDLAEVVVNKSGEEIGDICRQALRQAFGITTQKQKVVQFVDVPVSSVVWKPTIKKAPKG
jgi:hypothetical protein